MSEQLDGGNVPSTRTMGPIGPPLSSIRIRISNNLLSKLLLDLGFWIFNNLLPKFEESLYEPHLSK